MITILMICADIVAFVLVLRWWQRNEGVAGAGDQTGLFRMVAPENAGAETDKGRRTARRRAPGRRD